MKDEIKIHCAYKQLVDITDLRPNPRNPNKHPDKQIALLAKIIRETGWRSPITVSNLSGYVVKGHGRLDAARLLGVTQIPVDFQDYDNPEQELADLVADNRISELAEMDAGALKDILQDLDTNTFDMDLTGFTVDDLEVLMTQTHQEQSEEGRSEEPEEDQPQGIYAFNEDALFPSSNKYGIPDILLSKCSEIVPLDVFSKGKDTLDNSFLLWQTQRPEDITQPFVQCFFVDDRRFETVWTDAVNMLERFKTCKNMVALCSPDFSLWREMPNAIQAYNVYRSRWVTRYWQEAGFDVMPTLNWSTESSYEFAFLGLPSNIPVVAVQCRTLGSKRDQGYFVKGIGAGIEAVKPQNVVIYGATQHQEWLPAKLPRGPEYHYVDAWTKKRWSK